MPHTNRSCMPTMKRTAQHTIAALCASSVLGLSLSLTGCAQQTRTTDASGADDAMTQQLDDSYAEFQGAWADSDPDSSAIIGVTGDQMVMATGVHQTLFHLATSNARVYRIVAYQQQAISESMRVEGDTLIIDHSMPVNGTSSTQIYQRLDHMPESVVLTPLILGNRNPGADEVEALQAELADRKKKEQDVRDEYIALLNDGTPQQDENGQTSPAVKAMMKKMLAVDGDNTTRLIEIVSDVGWIDAERFGKEASTAAFLIVQHSGNLRLMRAALPAIEATVETNPSLGGNFALLYDRTHLALGQLQRYGTQIVGQGDEMRVARMEPCDDIDALRATVGLGPLDAYITLIEETYGGTVLRD